MNKYFEFGNIRPFHYFFSISALLGVLFSLVSTNEQSSYITHLLLWLLQTTGPIFILVYTHVMLHKLSNFDRLNPFVKLFLSGVLGAVLFSPIALLLDIVWGNDDFPDAPALQLTLWLDELGGVLPPIVLSWIVINTPWLLGFGFVVEPLSEISEAGDVKDVTEEIKEIQEKLETERAIADEPEFLGLLDTDIGSDIIYLQSELHYVKVVTTLGKGLVLYNLRDAIEQLPKGLGEQTHRSYWVSFAHIRCMQISKRQGILQLSNGEEIPVSRSKVEGFKRFE